LIRFHFIPFAKAIYASFIIDLAAPISGPTGIVTGYGNTGLLTSASKDKKHGRICQAPCVNKYSLFQEVEAHKKRPAEKRESWQNVLTIRKFRKVHTMRYSN
jgi:hypothetical protein